MDKSERTTLHWRYTGGQINKISNCVTTQLEKGCYVQPFLLSFIKCIIMILLDVDDIFGALIGIVFFGVLMFIIFGLISKASGKSLGIRKGITYPAQTIMHPDALDNAAKEVRKVFDKKYKLKTKIEEEYKKILPAIENQILFITYIRSCFLAGRDPDYSWVDRKGLGRVGNEVFAKIRNDNDWSPKITNEDMLKLNSLNIDLEREKVELLFYLQKKYE